MRRARRRAGHETGMSLVEVLVAGGIMAFLALAVTQITIFGHKGANDASIRAGFADDLNSVSGGLQKFMTSNDFRFFAFSGDAVGVPVNPKPLVRYLIPQPGRCRDLSTGSGCAEQTSFVYVNYDKTTTRAMTAVCLLPQPDPADPWLLVINTVDSTYGTTTFNPGKKTISVTDPGEALGGQTLAIEAGTVLATFSPPIATLFVAVAEPASTSLKWEGASGKVKFKNGTQVPDSCVALLPPEPGNPGKKKVDTLVEIQVRPYVLSQFTGNATVTPSDVTATAVNMPLRVSVVRPRSVGPLPVATPPGKFDFGFSDCTLDSATFNLSCTAKAPVVAQPVDRVRLDELFAVGLFDATTGASVAATRFELLAAGMTASASCVSGSCGSLTVPANGAFLSLVSANERLDNLLAPNFSLIKQENLSDLKFRVITALPTEKTEAFNVHFP